MKKKPPKMEDRHTMKQKEMDKRMGKMKMPTMPKMHGKRRGR